MPTKLDTIIIGAGWAGVVAAPNLAQNGHKVLVLEARNRVGGRARTHVEGMHMPVDLGCSWIHGYKEGNPARAIAKELGVAAHLPSPTESAIYGAEGRLPQLAAFELQDSLKETHASALASAKNTSPPPSASLASAFFDPQSALCTSSTPDAAKALARTLEVPFGAPLEQLSLRWAGWEDAFGGSDAAPEGGFQALVEKVLAEATRTHNAEVRLGETVNLIREDYAGVRVATDRGAYTAQTVICTIPLGALQHSAATLFEPALPERRMATIVGTHVGVLEKLALAYAEAWWPDAGTIGAFTFLPTAAATDAQTPRGVLDASTLSVASFAAPALPAPHATLLFYLSPTPALGLARFAPAEVAAAAHAFLVERFGVSWAPPAPSAYVLTDWHKDPLAMGATTTPSVVGEGRGPLDFAELGKPLWAGRLGFSGEHTEMNHRGSVAGAVISGLREAERVKLVLARLADA